MRRAVEKRVRYELHTATLETYLAASIAPKGLNLFLRPATSQLSNNNAKRWQDTLQKSSLELLRITVNHYRSALKSLMNEEKNMCNQTPLSTLEVNSLCIFEEKKRNEICAVKCKKLLRDGVMSHCTPAQLLKNLSTAPSRFENTPRSDDVSNVVNISNCSLSKDEMSVLSRGLKFCPATGHCDEFQLLSDLDNFARNLRLREFFHGRNNSSHASGVLPSAKRWTPPLQRDKYLDLYIDAVQRDVIQAYRQKTSFRRNLRDGELKAIELLRKRDDITIKPADKGGAIVVMNTADYIKEALRQLNDTSFYKRLDADPTMDFKETLKQKIYALWRDKKICDKAATTLVPLSPSAGRFYMLPKIHKPNNPGRPIVSANGTVTEDLSCYVDSLIRHLPATYQSFLRDTNHFLSVVNDITVPNGSFLVTLDVSSLYTNIPHSDGIFAVVEAYEKCSDDKPVNSTTIAVLLEMILHMNNFIFNEVHYVQVSGTSMGTKIGPNYANIFMGKLEEEFLRSRQLKPLCYKRFIDDIFFIWPHGESHLLSFISDFNNVHPSISFTHVYSTETINFLDVSISLINGNLITKLYQKPTDRQQYLHFNSSHAKHCKSSIPYSQAVRFKRLCSEQADFIASCDKLRVSLLKQKYPALMIDDAVARADMLDRKTLINAEKHSHSLNNANLVLTHSASAPNVAAILRKHHNILTQSDHLKEVFSEPPRAVFRRCRNLQDILTSSKVRTNNYISHVGCHPCRKPRCKLCKQMTTTAVAKSSANNFTLKIRGDFTCDTDNAVYLLECSFCHLQYIGHTENSFRYRFNNHKAHVHSMPHLPISRHVATTGHSFESFRATVLEAGFTSHYKREIRESFLIHKFGTASRGLNENAGKLASIIT